MTAKRRVKKLLKKRKNKEITDDRSHTRRVRRTQEASAADVREFQRILGERYPVDGEVRLVDSLTLEEQRRNKERWASQFPEPRPAYPGEPSGA